MLTLVLQTTALLSCLGIATTQNNGAPFTLRFREKTNSTVVTGGEPDRYKIGENHDQEEPKKESNLYYYRGNDRIHNIGKDYISGTEYNNKEEEHPREDRSIQSTTTSTYTIQKIDEFLVTNHGLYFTNFKFGVATQLQMIVYKSYIFVTWYRGGMDDRHVMLSRSKIDSDQWQHIQFPHRHVGFRGNPLIGDSHNSIAVGICPNTDSVHLLFDMHAYSEKELPNDYFNYRYSIKGAAMVEDKHWSLELFYPKQRYLNPNCRDKYALVTYPEFMLYKNNLMAIWRVGGDKRSNMEFILFDGNEWTEPFTWDKANKFGIYGKFSFHNDQMFMVFSRRTKEDEEAGYQINRGIYFAHSKNGTWTGPWTNIYETQSLSTPIHDITPFKVLDPSVPDDKYMIPSFVQTDDNTLHFFAKVREKDGGPTLLKYYRKLPNEHAIMTTFLDIDANGIGSIEVKHIGNTIFLICLDEGKLVIYSAMAGTLNFEVVYRQPVNDEKKFCNGYLKSLLWKDDENKWNLFLYAMVENQEIQDQRPLSVFQLLLSDVSSMQL